MPGQGSSTSSPTWYDVLGVDRDASTEEIRVAWRAATDRVEPGTGQFRVYNEAAETLLEPERRSAYDASLAPRRPEPTMSQPPAATDEEADREPGTTTVAPSTTAPPPPAVDEDLAATTPYASWGRRATAALIDSVLGMLAALPLLVLPSLVLRGGGSPSPTLVVVGGVVGVLLIVGFGLWNFGWRQGRTGRTLGKSALGIALVREVDHQPTGVPRALAKTVLRIVDQAPLYLGYLWPLWDDKRQTFSDKIVSTIVVREPGGRSSATAAVSVGVLVPLALVAVAAVVASTAAIRATPSLASLTGQDPALVGDQAMIAAEQAAEAMLSYDYRQLPDDQARAEGFLTGAFKTEFTDNFELLAEQQDGSPGPAVQTKAVVTAQAAGSGVVDVSQDGRRARVLVFVNQTSEKEGQDPQIFQNRVAMTLVERDGRWLVTGLNSY